MIAGKYKLLEEIGAGGMGVVWMAEQRLARAAAGGGQTDQGGHGFPQCRGPLRGRAPGPGDDGPSQHRPRFRRRHDRRGAALLRHGIGAGAAGHAILRPAADDRPRSAAVVHASLPRRAARPPEGHHPPRHQAQQRPGDRARWSTGAEGHRFRPGQGPGRGRRAHGAHPAHGLRHGGRHSSVHGAGTSGDQRPGRRHAGRHLRPGRVAVRVAHRLSAIGSRTVAKGSLGRGLPRDPRGGAAASQHADLHQPLLPSLAASRQSEPGKLSGLIKGDLDWIVLKALEKERNRRYDTATALVADIERHLHDEPVVAVPPTFGYRARKFVRKHRGPVVATAVAAALLALGLAATTWQWRRATQMQA